MCNCYIIPVFYITNIQNTKKQAEGSLLFPLSKTLIRLFDLQHFQCVGRTGFTHFRAACNDVLVAGTQNLVFDQHSFHFVQRSIVVGTGRQNHRTHAAIHCHAALGGNARSQGENRQGDVVAADFEGG